MVSASNDFWTFTIHHPSAHAVWLMGDFNNWSTTATPMQKIGPNTWQIVLRLTGQVCRYCFFAWLPERGHGVIFRDDGQTSRQGDGLAPAPRDRDAAARLNFPALPGGAQQPTTA